MKKQPDIKDLLQAIRRAEDLVKIYERQQRELQIALLSKQQRVHRLQTQIDAIQTAKETEHLSALELATVRGLEFPAVKGRVYRTPTGVRYVVSQHDVTSLLSIYNTMDHQEYMAGFDPETLALHFFYHNPKAIVVGAGK